MRRSCEKLVLYSESGTSFAPISALQTFLKQERENVRNRKTNKGRDKENKKRPVTKRGAHRRSTHPQSVAWTNAASKDERCVPYIRQAQRDETESVGRQQQILRFPLTVAHNRFLHRLRSVSPGRRGSSHLPF